VLLEKQAKAKQKVEAPYSDHTKIYEHYLAAVNCQEDNILPLEIHQAALRACTPSSSDIRVHTARLLQRQRVGWHQITHPYEPRFQKIMQNIADAGFDPSIKDYHFIMSQFAAAGHHDGIPKYMRHMRRMGLEPNHQTFGYFLQAIAHRISLPVPTRQRPAVIRRLVDAAMQVLREMSDRRMPPSPANLDLAFRILCEVHDSKSLTESLKLGYGMDLDYLDSPPIAAASAPSKSTADSSPVVLRFSTSTLNSLLETLGRWGHISKMMSVYEAVTAPLPAPAKPDNTFDDDDDDFLPIKQEWKPPSAKPNTTTFNILIRNCVDHGYSSLAKHYARWAVYAEHMSINRLRDELREKPLSEVMGPIVAVSPKTLRPILALANRRHDIELLRWVRRMCKLAIRLKYRSWTYYTQTRSKYESPPAPPTSDTPATPESSSSSSPSQTPPSKVNPRPFFIGTHIYILRQDIASLCDLKWEASNTLSDAITKKKAWMGRRIWEGKDVYMRDVAMRMNVDPETWKDKVNFKESRRRVVKPRPKAGRRKRYSHVGEASP